MKKNNIITLAAIMLVLGTFTGCTVVAGIFKAGVWVGVLAVVLVVAAVIAIISKMGKK